MYIIYIYLCYHILSYLDLHYLKCIYTLADGRQLRTLGGLVLHVREAREGVDDTAVPVRTGRPALALPGVAEPEGHLLQHRIQLPAALLPPDRGP